MLQRVELAFDDIVGAIDKANAASGPFREVDDVSPEEPAMILQMRQNDVDGLSLVRSWAALGTAVPERTREAAYGATYVFQFIHVGRMGIAPPSTVRRLPDAERLAQLGKEFCPSLQPVSNHTKSWSVVLN